MSDDLNLSMVGIPIPTRIKLGQNGWFIENYFRAIFTIEIFPKT